MCVSDPNSIETPYALLAFHCDCFGQIGDGFIGGCCSPPNLGGVPFLTESDEVLAPLIAVVVQVMALESWLGFVEILHNIILLSQVCEARG